MLTASLLVALLGVAVSAVVAARLGRDRPPPGLPRAALWGIGLGALAPAWIVAFWGLLGIADEQSAGPRVFSSAAALVGVIATDAAVRRLGPGRGGPRRLVAWLLGVAALAPAWGIALLGLARTLR